MEGKLIPWSRFRREDMYTIELNNIMEVNLVNLRQFYKALANHMDFKKKLNFIPFYQVPDYPSVDQMVSFLHMKIPNVSDTNITQAWYLSKMIVMVETEQSEFEYTFMRWPEFLEFVPRLAYFKFNKQPVIEN